MYETESVAADVAKWAPVSARRAPERRGRPSFMTPTKTSGCVRDPVTTKLRLPCADAEENMLVHRPVSELLNGGGQQQRYPHAPHHHQPGEHSSHWDQKRP